MLVTPGNSREVMAGALRDFSDAPRAATAAAIQALDKAGFGLVHIEECAGIIRGLLTIAEIAQPPDIYAIDPRVAKAAAFVKLLEESA